MAANPYISAVMFQIAIEIIFFTDNAIGCWVAKTGVGIKRQSNILYYGRLIPTAVKTTVLKL